MLASVIEHIIGLVDTSLLSGLSAEELGGAGLGIHLYFFIFMICFGLTAALQIIFSRRVGEKQEKLLGKSFINGAGLIGLYYILGISLIYFFGETIFNTVISDQKVAASIFDYLSTRGTGLIFTCLSALYGSFFISINKSYAITISSIIVLISNWLLDIALINGNWGFPELRVQGAALASTIASVLGFITLFICSFAVSKPKYFNLYQLKQLAFKEMAGILKIAYPLIIQMFIAFFGWTFFFLTVEKMGAVPLQIATFLRPIYILMLLPFVSFGNATSSMISNLIGQNRISEIKPLINKILQITIPLGLIISSIVFTLTDNILNKLSDNQELINNSVYSMKVIASSLGLYSIGAIYFNAITGTGNTKRTLLVEIITMVTYLAPVYLFVIVLKFPIHWVWLTEHVYFISMGLTSILVFRKTKLISF